MRSLSNEITKPLFNYKILLKEKKKKKRESLVLHVLKGQSESYQEAGLDVRLKCRTFSVELPLKVVNLPSYEAINSDQLWKYHWMDFSPQRLY